MPITRRSALKGLSLGAGAPLLLPIMNQITAQAEDSPTSKKPMRFLFVVEGNGMSPGQVQPKGITLYRGSSASKAPEGIESKKLSDYELSAALEPLKDHIKRMTIIQGLSGRVCGGGHSNNYGALGAYASKGDAAGETIDAALAKALPGIFPHVGVGISDRPGDGIIYNISAWDKGKKLPIQCKPDLAYNTFFGSVAKGAGKQAFDARTNLLDFMAQDVKKLESTLTGDERNKLQQHLSAYESMKDRQAKLTAIEQELRKNAPEVTDKYRSEVETDRLSANFDVAAATLIGGLTNVAVIASGCGDQYFSVQFKGLGVSIGKHGIGHGGGADGKTAEELTTIIRRFHCEQISRLIKKLESVKEGNGTMMDNTTIVYLSDGAESHHSRCWEWPVVLIGNLGGRLKTGDRYLSYPYHAKKGHRTMSNLYTTFLHAVGKPPRDQFGMIDPALKDFDQKGPLAELI